MRKSKWINDICWIRQPLLCALTLQYFSFHSLPLQGCCSYHCVLYQVSLLQKIPNCWPLCSAGVTERHSPASTGLSACPTPAPTGFEPSQGRCRQHCPSKHNLTLSSTCDTVQHNSFRSWRKFTFIRAKHKGLVLIFCFNFHLQTNYATCCALSLWHNKKFQNSSNFFFSSSTWAILYQPWQSALCLPWQKWVPAAI